MSKIYIELLAEDKSTITYRPRLASFTNSALAAILLQQIIYWWKKTDGKPFFKFRAPSSHKKYHPGDSWCEELELNPHEFDGALKIIGTKITKGISKADMLATEMPTQKDGESDQEFYDRLRIAVSRCVVYWTDSSRITWYLLNEQLLGNFVSRIYLDKCYSLKYLKSAILADTYKSRVSENTSKTETNAETTTETKAAAKSAAAATESDKVPVVTSTEIDKAIFTPIKENVQTPANAENPLSSSARFSPIDPRAEVFTLYHKCFDREVDKEMLKEELLDLVDTYTLEWCRDAFKETARKPATSLNYTISILKRWQLEGRNNLAIVPKPADAPPPPQKPIPANLFRPATKVSGGDNGK